MIDVTNLSKHGSCPVMKSIFLIKTPLQLLNAIEAKHHYNLLADDCVLIIMGDRKSQPQILALANEVAEWGNLIVLDEVPLLLSYSLDKTNSFLSSVWKSRFFKKSIFYVRRLNSISKALGRVDYIFIGYARYVYMKHFVNTIPYNELLLLDDGNATIQLARERREGLLPSEPGLKKRVKLAFKHVLQGVKSYEKDALGFFTIYDVSAGEKDYVVKNTYSYIRSQIDSLPMTESVYFLGSPLSETGIIDEWAYIDSLQKVKEYFSGKNIIYVIHRRESKSKLDQICKKLGFKMVLFDYPIEYQLAMIGPRPSLLCSFFSSALDSCGLIFGDKLKIISFELSLDSSPRKCEIEAIYNSYRANKEIDIHVESL